MTDSGGTIENVFLESSNLLEDNITNQLNEIETKIASCEFLVDRLKGKTALVGNSLKILAECQEQKEQVQTQVEKKQSELERKFHQFSLKRERRLHQVTDKANVVFAKFPTVSRQELQDEKTAQLFAHLRATKDEVFDEFKNTEQELIALQAKNDEERAVSAAIDQGLSEGHEKNERLQKEIETAQAELLELTNKTKDDEQLVLDSEQEVTSMSGRILSEEAQQQAWQEMEVLEKEVAAMEEEANEAEALEQKLAEEQEELEKACASALNTLEETTMSEETTMQMQLTDMNGQLHHVQLLHRGAAQRVDVTRKRVKQEFGGLSLDEAEKKVTDRAKERADKMAAGKQELERLQAVRAEKEKEVARRMHTMHREFTEKMAALSKLEADVQLEIKNVTKRLEKEAKEEETGMAACAKLEEEIERLELQKKLVDGKIQAFTVLETPSKPKSPDRPAPVSRQSSGDSDVTEASLDVTGIEPFSPETVRERERRRAEHRRTLLYSDESGAEERRDDTLFSMIRQKSKKSDVSVVANSQEDVNLTAAEDQGEEEREATPAIAKVNQPPKNLGLASDDSLNDTMPDHGADIISDLDFSADEARLPARMFLDSTATDKDMEPTSPPAKLSDISVSNESLLTNVSMQSVWD